MTYTKEQINGWNSKMAHGWKTDLRTLAFHNEKRPSLNIAIKDTNYFVNASLWFQDYREGYSYTGLKVPQLHLALYLDQPERGVAVSHGMGYTVTIGEPRKRAMFSALQKLTENFPPEIIMQIAKDNGLLKAFEGV